MKITPATLSLVAPCFNEQQVLPEFLRRASAACEVTGLPYEIILVDDGSTDGTWALIAAAAAADSRVRGLRLRRNHGHQLALTAGLHAARGNRVLTIDADLQDPPELLKSMLTLMESDGADVVYGQRRRRAGERAFKRITAWAFYRLINKLSDVPIPPDTGDFRLMRGEVVEVLRKMPENHRFIRGMVAWIGGRQIPVLYERDARYAGDTKYPLRRMLRLAIDALTGFSVRPLMFVSHLGIVAGFCSVGLALWSILGWIVGANVPGWTSIMAALGILTSIQLLSLGVLGQYLGRLYHQSQERPLYLVGMTAGRGLASAEQPHVAPSPEECS